MEPKIITMTEPKAAGEPFFREMLYQAPAHDFNLIKAEPGFQKTPHPYPYGDSFMLVVAGSMELLVDGQSYSLKAGQVAQVPKGAARGFNVGPDGLTMFAIHLRDM